MESTTNAAAEQSLPQMSLIRRCVYTVVLSLLGLGLLFAFLGPVFDSWFVGDMGPALAGVSFVCFLALLLDHGIYSGFDLFGVANYTRKVNKNDERIGWWIFTTFLCGSILRAFIMLVITSSYGAIALAIWDQVYHTRLIEAFGLRQGVELWYVFFVCHFVYACSKARVTFVKDKGK